MSIPSQIYRPRLQTACELESEEQRRLRQVWARSFASLEKKEEQQHSAGKARITSSGDISFVDSVLSNRKMESRESLDQTIYDERVNTRSGGGRGVRSLTEIAQSVCASDYKVRLRDLGPEHLPIASGLLQEIVKQSRNSLPFRVYYQFATLFGSEVMDKWRTYRGLALSDRDELRWTLLDDTTCFVAMIDFSSIKEFGDSELWRLNSIAPRIVSMNLSGTSVTDFGIGLMNGIRKSSGGYAGLEILLLAGLSGVTDKSSKILSQFTRLRMLDLCSTSCVIVRNLMNRELKTEGAKWQVAAEEHSQLFGYSFSASTRLSRLHALVDPTPRLRHLVILINSFDHQERVVEVPVGRGETKYSSHRSTNSTHGTIFALHSIDTEVLDEAANKEGGWKRNSDGTAGGKARTPFKPPSLYLQRKHQASRVLRQTNAYVDWSDGGSDDEVERPIHTPELSSFMLLRLLPLDLPALVATPVIPRPVKQPLVEGAAIIPKKRPLSTYGDSVLSFSKRSSPMSTQSTLPPSSFSSFADQPSSSRSTVVVRQSKGGIERVASASLSSLVTPRSKLSVFQRQPKWM